MFKDYYQLTKPGIIYGNVMTAAAGFLLAARTHVALGLFLATLAGTSFVIAAACVFNNYIDRDIDLKMNRTKRRALVRGSISGRNALIYAAVLLSLGLLALIFYTNELVVLIGVIAFVDYVVLYGIAKRRSVHGTLVGSVAGAAPIVAGYVAVTGRFDKVAGLLFLLMVVWQMPHFYAIAMYRLKDYRAAGIPVLPALKSQRHTKLQIVLYVAAFFILAVLFGFVGYARGYSYLMVMGLLSASWLYLGVRGFKVADDVRWARQMFFFSLVVVLGLSIMLPVGAWLA